MNILIGVVVEIATAVAVYKLTGQFWPSLLIGFVIYTFYLALSDKPHG